MLGSDYRELIVPRTDNASKKAGILIGGALVTIAALILSLLFGNILTLIPVAALGIGVWWLWTNNRIEYEYIIAGDELTLTKILAESRRKPMTAISIKKCTAFGKLAEAPARAAGQTIILACSAQDETAYFGDFEHDTLGNTRLIWTPNDDILEYLSKHLPRNIGYRFDK